MTHHSAPARVAQSSLATSSKPQGKTSRLSLAPWDYHFDSTKDYASRIKIPVLGPEGVEMANSVKEAWVQVVSALRRMTAARIQGIETVWKKGWFGYSLIAIGAGMFLWFTRQLLHQAIQSQLWLSWRP